MYDFLNEKQGIYVNVKRKMRKDNKKCTYHKIKKNLLGSFSVQEMPQISIY